MFLDLQNVIFRESGQIPNFTIALYMRVVQRKYKGTRLDSFGRQIIYMLT